MASKAYRLSGKVLKDVQAIAKAGGITEGELVRDLVRVGLGRIQIRISKQMCSMERNEQKNHT